VQRKRAESATSMSQIADATGVSAMTVQRILKAFA
jgi:hypothetical protein